MGTVWVDWPDENDLLEYRDASVEVRGDVAHVVGPVSEVFLRGWTRVEYQPTAEDVS